MDALKPCCWKDGSHSCIWLMQTHKCRQVCCAQREHWFDAVSYSAGGLFSHVCTYRASLCWDSLMGKTEKVVLVEAALRLIPPADRASSPLFPHKHTHMHRPSHKYTVSAAGLRLTQKVWSLIGSLHFCGVEKFLWHRHVLRFVFLMFNSVKNYSSL